MDKFVFGYDLGGDTVKVFYATVNNGNVRSAVVKLDDLEAYPAVAYYDEETCEWIFGERAVIGDNKSQKPIVKIKDLLSLCGTKNLDEYTFKNKILDYSFEAKNKQGRKMKIYEVVELFIKHTLFHFEKKVAEMMPNLVISGSTMLFTYPATANDIYKMTLKKYFESFGFVTKAMPEPSASAMCCIADEISLEKRGLLLDIGSDVTSTVLFEKQLYGDERIKLLKLDSISIGGNDFDEVFYNYAFDKFSEKQKLTSIQELALKCSIKDAKEVFCSGYHDYFIEYQADFVVYKALSDQDFFDATEELEDKFIGEVIKTIKKDDVSQVVLTGGGSGNKHLTSKLKEAIESSFARKKIAVVELKNSKFSVAKGAAVGATNFYKMKQIAPKSYGFECYKEGTNILVSQIMVKKNSPLPIKMTDTFTTNTRCSSTSVSVRDTDLTGDEVKVTSKTGSSMLIPAEFCNSILSGVLDFGEYVPSGTAIEATISIDENGIGSLTAVRQGGKGMFKGDFIIK